jgi:ectoine hydroxylase-related dioxygenase (phytanoyl-CoA dioxygenase family)
MWALEDFSEEIGATQLVLGSHEWPRSRTPLPSEAVSAVMPKGSCVVYLSSTWHGSGGNVTASQRMGLNIDYNSAFLRQEENQYLANPPEV